MGVTNATFYLALIGHFIPMIMVNFHLLRTRAVTVLLSRRMRTIQNVRGGMTIFAIVSASNSNNSTW